MNERKLLAIKLIIIYLAIFLLSASIGYWLITQGIVSKDSGALVVVVAGAALVVVVAGAALVAGAGAGVAAVAVAAVAVAAALVALAGVAAGVAAAGVAGVALTLVSVLLAERLKNLPIPAKKYTKQKIDVANIFLKEKSKTNKLIILLYSIAILAFFYYEKDLYAILSAIIMALFIIHQQLLKYRINKGYYANNAYETLELIEFIVANSKDIDFSDGDNQKSLFPEKATQKVNEAAIKGVKA